MKLSTGIIVGALVAGVVAAAAPPAKADVIVGYVYEQYVYSSEVGPDYGSVYVSASLIPAPGVTLTNVMFNGFGPNGPYTVAPGGFSGATGVGDPDAGGKTSISVTGLANGKSFYDVGSIWDGVPADAPAINGFPPSSTIPVYDLDFNTAGTPGVLIGVLAVPEPVSMTLLGVSLLGLAAVRRRRRS